VSECEEPVDKSRFGLAANQRIKRTVNGTTPIVDDDRSACLASLVFSFSPSPFRVSVCVCVRVYAGAIEKERRSGTRKQTYDVSSGSNAGTGKENKKIKLPAHDKT